MRKPVLPFRVYGATQKERDRVLAYLEKDMPELDMDYMEKKGKRFPNKSDKNDDFSLDPETLDQAFNLIQFFLNRNEQRSAV